MTSGYAAFASPDFRRFQAGRLAGILGLQMVSVAVGWQVYDLTHRALDLGYVGLVQFVPSMLLWPLAGLVADRVERRGVVLATACAQIVATALLVAWAVAGVHSLWPIYGTLLLLSVARAFGAPANQAMLPHVVPPEHFANAVTWSSTMFQVGSIAGPALGGAVYAVTGQAAAVYASAIVLLATAGTLLAGLPRTPPAPGALRPGWSDVLEGVRFVRARPVILGAISLDLFAVLLGGAVALLPIFARDVLVIGPAGLGVLRAAPAVGAATMAIFLSFRPIGGRAGAKLLVSVAVFGVATVVFGVSSQLWLSVVALVVIGASDELSVVVRQTIVQIATPDAMRGRVSAVNFLFINISNEIGAMESGLTAHWFGARRAAVLGGVGSVVVVALAAWRSPALRRVDRLDELRPG